MASRVPWMFVTVATWILLLGLSSSVVTCSSVVVDIDDVDHKNNKQKDDSNINNDVVKEGTGSYFSSWLYDQIEENVEYVQEALGSKLDTVQETFEEHRDDMLEQIEDSVDYVQETIENQTQQMYDDYIEESVEKIRSNVENITTQIQNDIQTMTNDMYDWKDKTEQHMKDTFHKYKERFVKDILNQRVGWERVRHSIRNHVGLFLGVAVAFRGTAVSQLYDGIPLQVGLLSWDTLKEHNLLPPQQYDPWLSDIVATIFGLSSKTLFKKATSRGGGQQPELPEQDKHPFLHDLPSQIIPAVFLIIWLFQFSGIVADEWEDYEIVGKRVVWVTLGTVLGWVWIHSIAQVPINVASSSMAGALLICDSCRAEIAGNWLYMMHTLGSISYRATPHLRAVIRFIVKRAIALWRLRKHVIKRTPQKVKELLSSALAAMQYALAIISYPLNTLRKAIFDHPVTKRVLRFSNRLRKGLEPIMWPMGISVWATAVQMGQIQGIGGIWRTFRFTIDPVSFVLGKFSRLLNTNEQLKRAFVTFLRKCFAKPSTDTPPGAGKSSPNGKTRLWRRGKGAKQR